MVGLANYNDPQFSTYELLRCDKIINYIIDGKKYYVPAVLRSQSSYNSGLWTSGRSNIEIVEDQQQFILPMNRDIEKVFYNLRILIDNKVLTEARAWKISKVNRITSNGVGVFTLAQDKFNPNADYRDDEGFWWANYFDPSTGQSTTENEITPTDNIYGVINCVGSQSIKVHGSYKKLSISYFNGEEPIDPILGTWHFLINDLDVSGLIQIKTDGLQSNEIKIKFLGESIYIGKEIDIRYIPTIGNPVDFLLPIVSL